MDGVYLHRNLDPWYPCTPMFVTIVPQQITMIFTFINSDKNRKHVMYNSPSESKYAIIYSDTEFIISCVYSTCL